MNLKTHFLGITLFLLSPLFPGTLFGGETPFKIDLLFPKWGQMEKHYLEFQRYSAQFGIYHSFTLPHKTAYEGTRAEIENAHLLFGDRTLSQDEENSLNQFLEKKLSEKTRLKGEMDLETSRMGTFSNFGNQNRAKYEAVSKVVEMALNWKNPKKKRYWGDHSSYPKNDHPKKETGSYSGSNKDIGTLLNQIKRDIALNNQNSALFHLILLEKNLESQGIIRSNR